MRTCVILGATNYQTECKCGAYGEPHAWESGAAGNWDHYQYGPELKRTNKAD